MAALDRSDLAAVAGCTCSGSGICVACVIAQLDAEAAAELVEGRRDLVRLEAVARTAALPSVREKARIAADGLRRWVGNAERRAGGNDGD